MKRRFILVFLFGAAVRVVGACAVASLLSGCLGAANLVRDAQAQADSGRIWAEPAHYVDNEIEKARQTVNDTRGLVRWFVWVI